MKIALITDTHIGARNDNMLFQNYETDKYYPKNNNIIGKLRDLNSCYIEYTNKGGISWHNGLQIDINNNKNEIVQGIFELKYLGTWKQHCPKLPACRCALCWKCGRGRCCGEAQLSTSFNMSWRGPSGTFEVVMFWGYRDNCSSCRPVAVGR